MKCYIGDPHVLERTLGKLGTLKVKEPDTDRYVHYSRLTLTAIHKFVSVRVNYPQKCPFTPFQFWKLGTFKILGK